ncbi:MAG TPA: hypothetical protein VFY17_08735 [Pilimelia sp.]|nr:hypothetical protein [Pilimelia sp.]
MKPTTPDAPRAVLTHLARAGATGTLHVGGDPPGTLQLADGAVAYAASPRTPGVGDLLTTGGRLPRQVWDSAVTVGTPDHRVGAVLIEDGHLTRGELELCALGVIYDAGFFVLGTAPVPIRFEVDRPHWLGPAARVPAATLIAETDRRRALLASVGADPAVDRLPVLPAPRVRRDRIQLSGLGWELLVHADGRRTVAALAHLLGRSGYVCLLEVRRLAADGLVRAVAAPPGRPGPGPPGDTAATVPLPRAGGSGTDLDAGRPGVGTSTGAGAADAEPGGAEPAGTVRGGTTPAGGRSAGAESAVGAPPLAAAESAACGPPAFAGFVAYGRAPVQAPVRDSPAARAAATARGCPVPPDDPPVGDSTVVGAPAATVVGSPAGGDPAAADPVARAPMAETQVAEPPVAAAPAAGTGPEARVAGAAAAGSQGAEAPPAEASGAGAPLAGVAEAVEPLAEAAEADAPAAFRPPARAAPGAAATAAPSAPVPGGRASGGLPRRKPARRRDCDAAALPTPTADPALLRRLRTALRRMT